MNDQHNKHNPKTESSVLDAIKSYLLYSVIFPLKLIVNILDWKEFKKDSSYVFSRILADEYLRLPLVILFWFFFSNVCIVIVVGSFALVGSLLSYVPWGEIPVSDDGRTLIQALTLGFISLSILSIEIQVMQKVAGVINKKFQKIAAGGRYEK